MTPFEFVSGQPWAILPAAHEGIVAVVERNPELAAKAFASLDPQGVASRSGRPMDNTRAVTVRDGVASIPVRGPLSRYATMFDDVCGMTSYQNVATDLQAAVDNPHVKAILLDFDTPGGTVTGCGELAGHIKAASKVKPVCGYVGGMACSAGYYLASACSEIVASPASMLGSIGVMCKVDTRKKNGELTFYSTQSPLKNADPLTEAGANEIQTELNALASVFIGDVAANRNTTPEGVEANFGRGGIRVGQAAVDCGMADCLGDYESTLARLSRGEKADVKPKNPPASKPKTPKGKSMALTSDGLLARLFKRNPEAVLEAASATDESDPIVGKFQVLPPVPAPAAGPSEDEIRAKVTAEFQAKAEADAAKLAAETVKAFYKGQADAYAAGLVKLGKLEPANALALVARYVDAATLDASAPLALVGADGKSVKLSRLDLLQSSAEGQPKARWTEDTIGADKTEFKGSFADCKILTSAASPDEEAAAKVAARHAEMLAASPAGQAHLASLKK